MTVRPILVVDDDPAVRDVVRQVLTLEGYAVIEAATGVEGVRQWQQHAPPLVILDILMPKMNGLEALAHIRHHGDTPVMMLTRKTSEDDKVRAFELGADDYLSKPFSSRELTGRVKAVLRRTRWPTPTTEATELVAGELRLDLGARRVSVGDRVVGLSRTEFQILTELARTPGRVLSREQLLTTVWGPEYRDDTRVLRCAIYRLRHAQRPTHSALRSGAWAKLERDADQPRTLRSWRDMGYWIAVSEEADA